MSDVTLTTPKAEWDGLWWLSTSFATFGVTILNGKVVREASAPISYKFAGQPFPALIGWLRKDQAFKMIKLLETGERIAS